MGFWRYCEKVSGCVGLTLTLKHIQLIHILWISNKTVGECAEKIKELKVHHEDKADN